METLDKKIVGDWYDIRKIIDDRFGFEDYFDFTETELNTFVQELRMSVERGTVEAKRNALVQALNFVDSLQFDTRAFRDFARHMREMQKLTYLSLLQRLYCVGNLAPRTTAQGQPDPLEDAVRQMEIKAIVEDVQKRVKANERLRSRAGVKNILMQVSIYRKEIANMKELAPNIPKEKYPAFVANFRKSFDEITRKMQDAYVSLLREEQGIDKGTGSKSMFRRFDFKPLSRFFAAQAQDFARIWSILSHADKERYKTREILSHILRRREQTLALVEREIKEYERFSFGHGDELAREFAAVIVDYLGRKTSAVMEDE